MKKLVNGKYITVKPKTTTLVDGKAVKITVQKKDVLGSGEKMKLSQALAALDPAIDAHWTQDGQPDLNAIKEMTGKSYKRAVIKMNAPLLTRTAAAKKTIKSPQPGR